MLTKLNSDTELPSKDTSVFPNKDLFLSKNKNPSITQEKEGKNSLHSPKRVDEMGNSTSILDKDCNYFISTTCNLDSHPSLNKNKMDKEQNKKTLNSDVKIKNKKESDVSIKSDSDSVFSSQFIKESYQNIEQKDSNPQINVECKSCTSLENILFEQEITNIAESIEKEILSYGFEMDYELRPLLETVFSSEEKTKEEIAEIFEINDEDCSIGKFSGYRLLCRKLGLLKFD